MKLLSKSTLLLLFLVIFSCNKEEESTPGVDQEMLQVNTEIDYVNEIDWEFTVNIAQENNTYNNKNTSSIKKTTPPCATISINNTTPGVFPKIFTIDFGNGCLHNGILRKGILTITFSDYWINSGSQVTIERTNYYVNGRKIEGTVTYQNITTNTQLPKWTRTVTNGKLTTVLGAIFTFSGTRTVQQIEGVDTIILNDNVYEVISGNHTVTRPNGTSLTATVNASLIKKFNCAYISQGKLYLLGTVLDGILDYGDNTCDNLATYTHTNGVVYNINL